ncbi:MAG TPA: DNA internalization-related competence protein ComEC/Rec2 [Clostridia bacterium]|nr:DNA internalization-related competence protein ComEC/Rec2 [Clostridia bacterium]
MFRCNDEIKIKPKAIIRPGTIVFALLVVTAFITTGTRLIRQERRLPGQEIAFSGLITDAGHASIGGSRSGERFQTIRLTDGRSVILWMKYPARKGDRVSGSTAFEIGEGSRNPGGFSQRMWLWSKGAGWIARPGPVRITERDGPLLWALRFPDRARNHVRCQLAPFWTSGKGPLFLSLSLGDTSLLSGKQSYELNSAGLTHLTCVSGTHLMFFMNPLVLTASKARLPRRLKQWLLFPIMLVPGVLSGWKSGITRASLASIAMNLDIPMRQRRDPLNTLLLVGSVMLIFQPYAVYGLSFWMSFSAAAAIAFCATKITPVIGRARQDLNKVEKLVFSIRKHIGSVVVFSAAAQLVILPYQLMSAPGIHLLAPLINVIAIPLAAYMTAAIYPFIAVLSMLPAGSGLARAATSIFNALLSPAAFAFEGLAGFAARTGAAFLPLTWCLPILLVCFIAYVLCGDGLSFLTDRRKGVAIFVALAGIFVSLTTCLCYQGWRVLFLDVGQGDATLFISPSGYTILIDGGDKGHGYKTVIPAARMYAVTSIDLAILTHGHSDHASGIGELLEVGLVKQLCLPPSYAPEAAPYNKPHNDDEEDMTDHLISIAENQGVPLLYLRAGDCLSRDSLLMEVLHPRSLTRARDLNEDSLVLRVHVDGKVLLMTGDLTQAGERSMLARGQACSADVLHVAHHGADKSTTRAFLKIADPDIAVISVGRDNRYGHPHSDVVTRLREGGSLVHRTDERGAVILNIKRGKGTIKTWIEP